MLVYIRCRFFFLGKLFDYGVGDVGLVCVGKIVLNVVGESFFFV